MFNLSLLEKIKEMTDNTGKAPSELKVFLGLSGGVDSAVAAFLLKEAGYQVSCGFMRNWDSFTNNDILGNPTIKDEICSQEKDYQDAESVAKTLGLPLIRIDFIADYWDKVFTDFIKQYRLGQTPNPDILCNRYIKFASFYDYARNNGFDFLATGHYAKLINQDNYRCLARAFDTSKDQSYFLAEVKQEALNHTLFPLSFCSKKDVREIASFLQLKVAHKKDSTGICFIGERNFKEFLSNYLVDAEGMILDIDTLECVGRHSGCMYYTYGQRKGLNISAHMGPWFVCGKDLEKKRLYVAKGENHQWLFSNACVIEDYNLLFQGELRTQFLDEGKLECTAKFRYRQADSEVIVYNLNHQEVPSEVKEWQVLNQKNIDTDFANYCYVHFKTPLASVSPGQEAVFYHGDFCGGGGRIATVFRNGQVWQDALLEYVDQKEKDLKEEAERRKELNAKNKRRNKYQAKKK